MFFLLVIYILGLNSFSPKRGVNTIYQTIGKIIRITEDVKPIIEISIIGTIEYRKNDCIPINFLILLLSNFFIDISFALKYKNIKVTNAKIIICHR